MKAFSKSSESGPRREKPLLSDREKEIVQLSLKDFATRKSAKNFYLRETVKNHLHNLFDSSASPTAWNSPFTPSITADRTLKSVSTRSAIFLPLWRPTFGSFFTLPIAGPLATGLN